LEIASSPRGTVISNVYDALSLGWSFTGYHVSAPWGWPTSSAPSSVWKKPDVSGSVCGTPSYAMRTANLLWSRSPRDGLIVSSPSAWVHRARSPFTRTDRTVRPSKSRLKLDRFWVALASILATPVNVSVGGS
jgi:hypothetical protein